MPFTDPGPFTNSIASPPVDASFLNNVRTALNGTAKYVAPPPSGSDDTAVLQPLVYAAQATFGTLDLQSGTYIANLVTNPAYQQPIIRGKGRYQTIIRGNVNTSPVIRFVGVSGGLAGGGLQHLGIAAAIGGGGIGFEIVGAGGTNSHDIRFSGDTTPNATGGATIPLSVGVHFYNRDSGMFTEFNTVEADFLDCNQPVFYEVSSGDPSFCGTGLVGNSTINLSTTTTSQVAITIGANAMPYNAPCSVTVHGQATSQVVFNNLNTSRAAGFYGTVRCEGINQVGLNNPIWYAGTLIELVASGATNLGTFYLVDKTLYSAGQFTDKVQYRPFQRTVALASTATVLIPEKPGTCTVQVDIVASNYHYAHLLYCWDSPYSTTGVVSQLANPSSINGAGYGPPVFAWTNNTLTVTNSSYSSSVTAWVSVVPFYAQIDSNKQKQA